MQSFHCMQVGCRQTLRAQACRALSQGFLAQIETCFLDLHASCYGTQALPKLAQPHTTMQPGLAIAHRARSSLWQSNRTSRASGMAQGDKFRKQHWLTAPHLVLRLVLRQEQRRRVHVLAPVKRPPVRPAVVRRQPRQHVPARAQGQCSIIKHMPGMRAGRQCWCCVPSLLRTKL